MHRSAFFKLFPPPKFLAMPYAGLDISDDAITCLVYKQTSHGLSISAYDSQELPAGLISGGDIRDEKAFATVVGEFARKNSISYARISLPEEKAYLFETDVPSADMRTLYQNIEFKLEQNVPLSAADAVFYFDLLPPLAGAAPRASVSVVPRTFVERYISLLRDSGIVPTAFEVAPKALGRAIVSAATTATELIVHIMNDKTGLYVVAGGVVVFTSTVAWGSRAAKEKAAGSDELLAREIARVYSYWSTRTDGRGMIAKILLAGRFAEDVEAILRSQKNNDIPDVTVANVWINAFDVNKYVPPISKADSLGYAVAAGLAVPSF